MGKLLAGLLGGNKEPQQVGGPTNIQGGCGGGGGCCGQCQSCGR